MTLVKIKFNNVALNKIDTCHKMLDLCFNYNVDKSPNKLLKSFSLDKDNVIGFTRTVMNEIKKQTKLKNSDPLYDDPFSLVTVVYDEREEGEMEEKVVKAVERIKNEIRSFKNVKGSDNYFAAYQRVNSMVVDIK